MRNWWVRFGCFLTGYNYSIIKNSSEVSSKAVKRYTSAILIVCILWSFIGFTFTDRYLKADLLGSFIGGIIFVLIIIQIERQIILTINPSWLLYLFRGILAMMMAIIGAIIIDQIIFKEDIELEKITSIENRVKKALGPKSKELQFQINSLDSIITNKEIEKNDLVNELTEKPTIRVFSTQTVSKTEKITTIGEDGKPNTSEKSSPVLVTTSSNVPNPKISLMDPLVETIKNLRVQKAEKENLLINIRPQLEKEISSKVGFLDELEVMYVLISKSKIALVVWFIWFFFLMGIELLVLISKTGEKENDYEKTVKHQMELQNRKLDIFSKMSD